MSAVFIAKFNGRPMKFRMVGVRKVFELVDHREATRFVSETEGWMKVREFGVKPLGVVTVETV